jgi:hypothetical protein
MERTLNWTGLLVEADRKAFHQLSTRNRKAYLAPVCLSPQPYPMEVSLSENKYLKKLLWHLIFIT